jgi:quinol-cytochrome oxidoreductase complex cytochrome b subunit
MLRVVEDHLGSTQVSRVMYGSIIGLALVVSLEHDPPRPAVMVGTLVGTAVAVGLAELYSEIVGTEVRTRQRVARAHVGEIAADVGAVVFGISFPAVFFILSAADAIEVDTAFELAKWSGLALIGLYGFSAARLAGAKLPAALVQAVAIALIGAFLIGLKALVH